MSKKILIVEDEPTLREAFELILKRNGYSVATAIDGGVALESIKDSSPDLILLDLLMPNVDGLEFLKVYSKTDPSKRAKVIVFSNIDTPAKIKQAFTLGADRYFVKAWATPKDLVRLIEDTLK